MLYKVSKSPKVESSSLTGGVVMTVRAYMQFKAEPLVRMIYAPRVRETGIQVYTTSSHLLMVCSTQDYSRRAYHSGAAHA